jgi:hypothetical protein
MNKQGGNENMKRWLIGMLIGVVGGTAAWAQADMRYDTRQDRTMVAGDNWSEGRWCTYKANELNFSFFGSGTVGSDTLDNISGDRIERDGELGAGAGISYFFTRYLGIEAYAFSESTGDDHFVDFIGGNLIARWPIANSGVAPYVFGGGGRQIDPEIQWYWDAGGGIEWRFAEHFGIFVDARYVWAEYTDDFGLGRVGFKFGF